VIPSLLNFLHAFSYYRADILNIDGVEYSVGDIPVACVTFLFMSIMA
jgi:hypothetical protein